MQGNCQSCERWGDLEKHHIFGGANRRKSEKYGLTLNLCIQCHREGKNAVHRNAVEMLRLHQDGQRWWMSLNDGTADDFRREFGKNYL